ncbi:MAG: AMP-binding protein, partial [Microcella sp.]|nr:AMP-binding protein [Microcella sp.]
MKEFFVPAVVTPDPDANASDLLVDRARLTPNNALFSLPTADGGWSDVTTAEFHRQVAALAKGFIAAGVKPGDKIGFMCKTRYEWTLVDFATWFAGAALVPIYETSSPSQVQYILDDSEAHHMIVETADHFSRFDEVAGDLPNVGHVWQMHLGDLEKLASTGEGVSDDDLEARRTTAKGSDLATLIYTSGSTGVPKGCILTHSNFVELCRNAAASMSQIVNPQSSTLLFITTAHVFARFISVLGVHGGVKIGHQADTKQLLASLGSFKPTFLLAVPRVFEKVYNSAEQKAEAGGKGKIFRKAADVAIEHSKALDAGSVPL